MRNYLIIFIILSLLACNDRNEKKGIVAGDSSIIKSKHDTTNRFYIKLHDAALENKITDTLMKLSFVKKSNGYIDSFSNHAKGMSFVMDTVGNKVSIMAGYDGIERFETYYNFEIDPSTMEIRIMDMESGRMIPVKQYIKQRK